MVFVLPPRAKVGYLDPSISGEGQFVNSEGETVNWTPPPAKPVMPDWSQIKSIRHLFNRTGYQVWPAWLYHPSESSRLVKNADEAADLGICYREATIDERGRYGVKAVWDWKDDSKWRPEPWPGTTKFNPTEPGHGKTYVPKAPDPVIAQNELVRQIVPEVAAAVAKALKNAGSGAPASIDGATWDEFLAFQAWKKTHEAVSALAAAPDGNETDEEEIVSTLSANALTPEQDRQLWEDEAKRKGVKVDGRWSLDKLRATVEKAA